jgi:hypothetical protein
MNGKRDTAEKLGVEVCFDCRSVKKNERSFARRNVIFSSDVGFHLRDSS